MQLFKIMSFKYNVDYRWGVKKIENGVDSSNGPKLISEQPKFDEVNYIVINAGANGVVLHGMYSETR